MARTEEPRLAGLAELAIDTASDVAMLSADWLGRHYWRYRKLASSRSPAAGPIQIIAHRGAWKASGLTENTMPAFEAAFNAGCWAVEFDVRPTKDGTLVVHHDDSLARTFGRRLQLSKISFSHLRHELPLVPTLDEVLSAIHHRGHLMIELKGGVEDWPSSRLTALEKSLGGLACGSDFHLMGLDVMLLRHVAQSIPSYKKGLVAIATTDIKSISKVVEEEKWAALAAHWLLLSTATIDKHHRLGQRCGIGYANSKEVFAHEQARNVDWIFTNHGHEAATWINQNREIDPL